MRFILVGTLNALITVLIVWLMMDKLGCNYIATNITAYVIAQINNFFWSKYWIFSSRTGKFRREIPPFSDRFRMCLLFPIPRFAYHGGNL